MSKEGMKLQMKITFLGATKIVTGSNFLVEAAGKKFIVDCGMYQGRAQLEEQNFREFDYNPAELDFMLLTHAHIDHSGRIPKLYNEGFKGPIYAHKATCDLCSIMLPDSGHIQEMEAEWKNKKRIRKILSSFNWAGVDSNHRSLATADLQSAPFSHSGTYPY